MSVTSTTETDDSLSVTIDSQSNNRGFFFSSGSVTSHVNASFANKFSYSVEGSSSLSDDAGLCAAAESHHAEIHSGKRDESGERSSQPELTVLANSAGCRVSCHSPVGMRCLIVRPCAF